MTENEYTPIYQLQQSVEQWLRRDYDSPFHVTALTVIKAYKQQAQDWPSLAAALPHHKIGDVYQAVNNLLDIKKQEAVYKKPVQPELLVKHLAAQGIGEDTATAIAAVIGKMRDLAEEINTHMGQRATWYAMDRCSGRPSWSESKAYKAPYLYAIHGTGESCPMHGKPKPNGRIRKGIGSSDEAQQPVLAAMANWETWRFANEEYKRVLSQYQALKHRIAGLAFTQKRLWPEGGTMD